MILPSCRSCSISRVAVPYQASQKRSLQVTDHNLSPFLFIFFVCIDGRISGTVAASWRHGTARPLNILKETTVAPGPSLACACVNPCSCFRRVEEASLSELKTPLWDAPKYCKNVILGLFQHLAGK